MPTQKQKPPKPKTSRKRRPVRVRGTVPMRRQKTPPRTIDTVVEYDAALDEDDDPVPA